jgi:hypothetical protein
MNIAVPAPSASKAFDTTASLTPKSVGDLKSEGYNIAIRYVSMLTGEEVDTILTAGLGLILVTTCRASGWQPTQAMGASDAAAHLADMQSLGILAGVSLFVDLEGAGGQPADLIAYVNAWASAINRAGYVAGAYVGCNIGLTSQELYDLEVVRYWKSASRIVDRFGQIAEPNCGFCLTQILPEDAVVKGVQIDSDFVGEDYHGRTPMMLVHS